MEVRSGLIPVNYVEEAAPISICTAEYDYSPLTDEEIGILEGDLVRVYEIIDENWWWVKVDHRVGLVPASYLRVDQEFSRPDLPTQLRSISPVSNVSVSSVSQAAQEKAQLMTVLDKFGFQPSVGRAKADEHVMIYGPDDVEYYPVIVFSSK